MSVPIPEVFSCRYFLKSEHLSQAGLFGQASQGYRLMCICFSAALRNIYAVCWKYEAIHMPSSLTPGVFLSFCQTYGFK